MSCLFNIFDLFLSPWIRIRIQIQKTPESGFGSETLKNKHIFDYFVLVFEQIMFINFHFISPSALLVI